MRGGALGRVMTRRDGAENFDTVGRRRTLAAADGGGAGEAGRWATAAALMPAEALSPAIAFMLHVERVNLAEENCRITRPRERLTAWLTGAGAPDAKPRRETIEAAGVALKEAGFGPAPMQAPVKRLDIALVLSVDPTEPKWRTLLAKRRRSGEIRRVRAQPAMLAPECVERGIASVWLADRSHVARPEVADAARTAP